MPSQSPVPVGLTPGLTPNWGTSAGSTPRFWTGNAETLTATRTAETKVDANFIVYWIERLASKNESGNGKPTQSGKRKGRKRERKKEKRINY
jgi:hypothetical protein